MIGSVDPQRMVATALISEDDALANVAAAWAVEPDRIPIGPSRAARTNSSPKQTSRGRHPQTPEDKAMPPSGIEPNPTLPEDLEEPDEDETGEPEAEVTEVTKEEVDWSSERAQLLRRITKLESEIDRLQASLPSRSEKRRQNRQRGELKRTLVERQTLSVTLEALREERDELLQIRHDLEEQLDEAEEARLRDQRKAQHLETQLVSIEGRAGYLQRMVEKDLEGLVAERAQLSPGPGLTRTSKKIETLGKLQEALLAAFPPQGEPEPPRRLVVRRQTLAVVVNPLGGGEEIGGSAILVEAGGRRIVVDVGLHPDGRGPLLIHEILDGRPLDAIVITHAHNDHAGFVPAIVNRFRNTPIFCSAATAQLLPTMWADSAKVMERAFEEAIESDRLIPPHYGRVDVEDAESRIQPQSFDRRFNVGDLGLTLFRAGHILGAAGLVVEAGDKRVVITGDISGPDENYLSVEPTRLPSGLVRDADLLVIETTYCDKDHANRRHQESGLIETVRSVVERRGRVLIPAFGLGRSQEVVMILAEQLPEVDVLVDGMAREVSRIYELIGAQAGKSVQILGGRVRPVQNRFREMQSFHSGVIVSASGMLTGGPSVKWAQEILPDDRAALLLCGYQDEEAPGRRLEELASGTAGSRTLTLPDQEFGTIDVPVKADVRKYLLSAHADQRGLADIVSVVGPKATMLVHGEPRRQAVFRALLRGKGVKVVPTKRVEL